MFPIPLLMESLKALRVAFPLLPATVFTEALGGSEQRLRDGAARLAIYTAAPTSPSDLVTEFMTRIAMWPVVATDHPLAAAPGPLTREALEPYVQLVLTDRTALTQNWVGGIVSRHLWRFADLATRLDFLLAGFGWCNMPSHMVTDHIAAGRLKKLIIANREDEVALPIYIVHERGRLPGRAGRWLIADLRERLKTCPGAHHRDEGKQHGRSRRRLRKPCRALRSSRCAAVGQLLSMQPRLQSLGLRDNPSASSSTFTAGTRAVAFAGIACRCAW